ncbi:hypothetical protein T05_2478 [Trichinella murrelli]|uniref:Uncharacterized protein n=1 Tax=Trichinella murrelli TaxID=144512 RepID=A0A0V0TNU9_9BILA|nr:hypothetical protein T05_2478 [Trichinella murrelli]
MVCENIPPESTETSDLQCGTDYDSGDLYIELRIVYSYGSRDQRSRQELLNRINSTQSREAEHPYR